MSAPRTDLVEFAIDAFNSDPALTRRNHPDSREHCYARKPIFALDCDYEVVSFSGVSGRRIPQGEAL